MFKLRPALQFIAVILADLAALVILTAYFACINVARLLTDDDAKSDLPDEKVW